MNLDELKAKVRAAKLLPVHIEGSPRDSDIRGGFKYVGSLDEFFEVARVLDASVVLICAKALKEADFYDPAGDESEDDGIEGGEIDLCSLAPELGAFKKHIGEFGEYGLSIASSNFNLKFFFTEEWYREFMEMADSAVDSIDNDSISAEEDSRKEKEEKDRMALAALQQLLNDPQFVRLPTQIVMAEYALSKIPELNDVPPRVLKKEIQLLHAQIKAKGLGRSR